MLGIYWSPTPCCRSSNFSLLSVVDANPLESDFDIDSTMTEPGAYTKPPWLKGGEVCDFCHDLCTWLELPYELRRARTR